MGKTTSTAKKPQRKSAKGKPTKKQPAKALDASTASVKRAPTKEREMRRDLASLKSIIKERNNKVVQEREQGQSGYAELYMDGIENPPQEKQAIATIADVVRALGGVEAVKDWLHSSEATIGNWVTCGYISGGQLPVYLALVDLGYTRINPALFNMSSWEDSRLPHMRRPALAA